MHAANVESRRSKHVRLCTFIISWTVRALAFPLHLTNANDVIRLCLRRMVWWSPLAQAGCLLNIKNQCSFKLSVCTQTTDKPPAKAGPIAQYDLAGKELLTFVAPQPLRAFMTPMLHEVWLVHSSYVFDFPSSTKPQQRHMKALEIPL